MPEEMRAVCGRLMADLAGHVVGFESLRSEDPLFVLRSANPTLFRSFFRELGRIAPERPVVVVSHGKARGLVEEAVENPHEFLAYPKEGPYSLPEFAKAFPRLREKRFGAKVLLDASGVLGGMEGSLEILDWLAPCPRFAWGGSEPCLRRLGGELLREAARKALHALADWNVERVS